MDEIFGSAAMAIVAGDLDALSTALNDEPGLATRASSVGHPSLLQLVACEAPNLPNAAGSAQVLIDANSELVGPLVAAAGCGSAEIVDLLLDQGAPIDGHDGWAPLDEALYWCQHDIAAALVARGAAIRALSTAAGLGYVDTPAERGGPIGSPFPDTVPAELANDPQSILDHAFVMAVNCGQQDAAGYLLQAGAQVNALPPGYHWKGTALHAACWRGDRDLVTWLLSVGADASIHDGLANSNAAGWAKHHGHDHLLELFTS